MTGIHSINLFFLFFLKNAFSFFPQSAFLSVLCIGWGCEVYFVFLFVRVLKRRKYDIWYTSHLVCGVKVDIPGKGWSVLQEQVNRQWKRHCIERSYLVPINMTGFMLAIFPNSHHGFPCLDSATNRAQARGWFLLDSAVSGFPWQNPILLTFRTQSRTHRFHLAYLSK